VDGVPVNPELGRTISVKVKNGNCSDKIVLESDHSDIPGMHYVRCTMSDALCQMPHEPEIQRHAIRPTLFPFFWRISLQWARDSSLTRFLDHTQRRTIVGRTPLGEGSVRRRNLYLTKHNTHNRQISMPPVGFEPTFSAGKQPQTYASDRAATVTGH